MSDEKKSRRERRKEELNSIPREFKPISIWGYFGYEVLFAIPVIGLIFMIIFSFSKNKNLRNFTLSHFCLLVIFLVIIIAALALGAGEILGEIAEDYFDLYISDIFSF